MKRQDYTNQKIGHLTIKEMLYGYGKHGEGYCRCICECGNECIKSIYGILHSRNPAHCGCKTEYYKRIQSNNSRKNLVGMRFGSLVVTEMHYKEGEHTTVTCKCDCGNVIERVATYLTSGDTTSCGCVQRQRASETNTKDFTGIISEYGVEFIKRSYKKNNKVWLWVCKCGKCGKEFEALPAKVLNGHTTSCGCSRQSSGERLIEHTLQQIGIDYKYEYVISDCKNVHPLRFDFYIPSINTAIEYQGAQHYIPVDYFGGELKLIAQQRSDEKKKKYCKENGIDLIEIPYTLSNTEVINIIQTLFIPRDCHA